MKSAWVSDDVMSHILAALTKENRLAVLVSLTTGLRISDVLGLRTDQLRKKFTITEQKTLKRKLVTLSDKLLNELIAIAGPVFVFEHRCDPRRLELGKQSTKTLGGLLEPLESTLECLYTPQGRFMR